MCLGNKRDDFVKKYGDECRAEVKAKGRAEGRAEGENLLGKLVNLLLSEGRTDDISKASTDEAYRKSLYAKYALV